MPALVVLFGVYKVKLMRELVEREAVAAAAALPSLDDAAVGPALARAARLLEERAGRRPRRERGRRGGGAADARRGRARPASPRRAARRRARAPARGDRGARAARARDREPDAPERAARCASCAFPSARSARTSRRGPDVALDVAAQLLKSLNTAVLRTGGAALRTVETLVDEVLRPALEAAGSTPARSGSCARPIAPEPRRSSRCRAGSRS